MRAVEPAAQNAAHNVHRPELTLFMLVTNCDCVLAHYSILSYRKLWKLYDSFVLEVYANCLTEENKARYLPRWSELPYVSIRDNEANGKISRRKGASFTSPEGNSFRYDDSCEHYDEVWTREHQLARTPFWATVDADFEVLSPEFIRSMMESLREDPELGGISTDYGPTGHYYDSYSNAEIKLNERWHTWCCIYRRETGQYLREVSSFYVERKLPGGLRHAFDSYANVQQHMIENGYRMASLPPQFQNQFIHYGAFSKNKSITKKNVWMYRHLAIVAKRGLIPLRLFGRLNSLASRVASRFFHILFSKAVDERRVYDFESD
jgi:hypothetical protein